MNDLFDLDPPEGREPTPPSHAPLAERMRPSSLDEIVGQSHIIAPGKLLRRAIDADRLSSLILYGPPGTGKTTLSRVIAKHSNAAFISLSGVENNVADLRKALLTAENRTSSSGRRTILFVDEIHRLNKSQQDVLLPDVEKGSVILIGATTHNPFFYLNSPLVSRSQIFQLEPVPNESLVALLRRAIKDPERGFGKEKVQASDDALLHLATVSEGDARKCLNALELGILSTPKNGSGEIHFTLHEAEECIQRKAVVYDRDGDQHFDTASALIKSIRGSDPDAALYWLARMLEGGEDVRFIARRLVIAASEDIGMADPQALVVAVAAQQAVEFIGQPECQIPLAQATVHLATSPKSNRSYQAILDAREDVRTGVTLAVPAHLRDKHYKGAERLGHTGYKYSHDYPDSFVPQAYLPEGRSYYKPSGNGHEKRVAERLEFWRSQFNAAR